MNNNILIDKLFEWEEGVILSADIAHNLDKRKMASQAHCTILKHRCFISIHGTKSAKALLPPTHCYYCFLCLYAGMA